MEIFTGLGLLAFVLFVGYFTRKKAPNRSSKYVDYANMHQWPDLDEYEQPIVGESFYQQALWDLKGIYKDEPIRVVLLPESDNPHDKLAVAAIADGKLIGYLSRDDARAFRRRCKKQGIEGMSYCSGKIFGGKGSKNSLGVWLDIKEL